MKSRRAPYARWTSNLQPLHATREPRQTTTTTTTTPLKPPTTTTERIRSLLNIRKLEVIGDRKPSPRAVLPPGQYNESDNNIVSSAASTSLWNLSQNSWILNSGTLDPHPELDRHQNLVGPWVASFPKIMEIRSWLAEIYCKVSVYAILLNVTNPANPQNNANRHQTLTSSSSDHAPSSLQKISSISIYHFWAIQPTNRQTDNRTEKQSHKQTDPVR